MKYKIIFATLLLIGLASLLLPGCNNKKTQSPPLQAANPALEISGKQLSIKYCSGCHLYPEPALLDKKSWKNVLPVMKAQMNKSNVSPKLFEWLVIEDFYMRQAPAALTATPSETLTEATTQFRQTNSFTAILPKESSATLVKYDKESSQLFVGDAAGNLYVIRKNRLVRSIHTNNIPVDIQTDRINNNLLVLGIGNFFPSEEKKGNLVAIDTAGNQHIIADSLKRPVQFINQDFDADGKSEYLIASFGSVLGKINSGKLSLFFLHDGKYQKKVIKESPGATKTVVGDFNHDGKPDFMALFAQGRESISMFLNKGNLTFVEEPLLEFPPVYGSNSFDLADINGDSYPDIIFTNGDNSDYSTIYKGYHGVRIFINNGQNKFQEKYFFPINGASRVVTRDFDTDGDLDLAVLAMFPDLTRRAQETLVYLQNEGNLHFNPSYLEKEPSAKWFLMDAGDIDQDGDEDLIVGANTMVSLPIPDHYQQRWKRKKISYTIFQNITPPKTQAPGFWQKFLNMF